MKFWFNRKKEEETVSELMDIVSAKAAETPAPKAAATSGAAAPESAKPVVVKPPVAAAKAPAAPARNERRELYYRLLNALYDAILVLDINGHVVDCNERVVSMLARTRDELWDVPIGAIVPSLNAQVLHQMMDGLHGKRRVLLNARCIRGDGSTFPAELGAGLMELIGENLVLSIRNIEKRIPAKAVILGKANASSVHETEAAS